jgi:hypothetical protein
MSDAESEDEKDPSIFDLQVLPHSFQTGHPSATIEQGLKRFLKNSGVPQDVYRRVGEELLERDFDRPSAFFSLDKNSLAGLNLRPPDVNSLLQFLSNKEGP